MKKLFKGMLKGIKNSVARFPLTIGNCCCRDFN